MVLAHRERLTPRRSQADLAAQRMRDYAEHGKPLGPLPSPGVFARHNAVDTPALLPDGTPAESSVSRVLSIRGTIRSAADLADDIDELTRGMRTDGEVRPGAPGESPQPAENEDVSAKYDDEVSTGSTTADSGDDHTSRSTRTTKED
jgi:NADH-quinone oxidoreductase subunit J